MKLLTIPFSHYCEKARWALELSGLPFEEEGHLPLFHYPYNYVYQAGRSVPVLVTDQAVIRDSTLIVRYLSGLKESAINFYPGDKDQHILIRELETAFDQTLGPHTRRWFYFHALQHPHLILDTVHGGVPKHEQRLLQNLFGLWSKVMKKGLNISPEAAERSLQKVRTVFDRVEALLADGRPYLAGDQFSTADLSFAALGAPMVIPDNYGYSLPKFEDFPAQVLEVVEQFRQRPGGEFILKLYRENRPPSIYQGYQPNPPKASSNPIPYYAHHTGIQYIEKGHGPTVVFLHGNGANASLYLPLIEHLAKTHRVIAPDLPGYGRSQAVQPPHLENYLDRLEQFLANKITEPFDLIGHSLGGFLSWGLVHRRPAWIKHLVWMEAAIFDVPLKYQLMLLQVAHRMRTSHHHYARIMERVKYLAWDEEGGQLDMLNQFMVSYLASDRVTQSLFVQAYPFIKSWKFDQIQKPVLCIRGEKDTLVSQATNKLAEKLPKGQLCIIPDAGHFLVGENDEALMKAIDDFLALPVEALS